MNTPESIFRMQKVESSNIEAIGYDAGKKELRVQFPRGATYAYFDVPEHVFTELMAAESKGRHFRQYVKSAGFKHERLTG